MAAGEPMAVVPSLGRIIPRWTALLLMLHAGWPSLWWRLSSAGEFWSRCVVVSQLALIAECKQQVVATRGFLCFIAWRYMCPCVVLGVLCHWSCPSALYFYLSLRNLKQEWKRTARHCEEELWSSPRSHCQVMYNPWSPLLLPQLQAPSCFLLL